MKRNDWQAKYGAKRRAIDKAILQEAERAVYIVEGLAKGKTPDLVTGPFYDEERQRIARAFGRPID